MADQFQRLQRTIWNKWQIIGAFSLCWNSKGQSQKLNGRRTQVDSIDGRNVFIWALCVYFSAHGAFRLIAHCSTCCPGFDGRCIDGWAHARAVISLAVVRNERIVAKFWAFTNMPLMLLRRPRRIGPRSEHSGKMEKCAASTAHQHAHTMDRMQQNKIHLWNVKMFDILKFGQEFIPCAKLHNSRSRRQKRQHCRISAPTTIDERKKQQFWPSRGNDFNGKCCCEQFLVAWRVLHRKFLYDSIRNAFWFKLLPVCVHCTWGTGEWNNIFFAGMAESGGRRTKLCSSWNHLQSESSAHRQRIKLISLFW